MFPQKKEKVLIFFWECIVSENVHNQLMGGIGNSTVGRKVLGPCYMSRRPAHLNNTTNILRKSGMSHGMGSYGIFSWATQCQ